MTTFFFSITDSHHEPQRADIVQRKAREVGLSLAGIAHGQSVVCHDGMCGSQSGSVPTNVGQPRIRVSELTVGGKGGAIE